MNISQKKIVIRERMVRFEALQPLRTATDDDIEQAREIVAGNVRFNGNAQSKTSQKLLTVGRRDIDWAGGHFHHQEWPTQMGRFFMLGPLMRAYRQAPEAVYAEAARDYIDDWIAHFDCEAIESRGNTCMDIGIRLGTHGWGGWACALATFMEEPSWDPAFIERMLASIERQAHILWKRGIPSRPWGNHRIFGLDGLLHVTLRLPFLADADAMLASARVNLEQAFRSQFMPDGSYIEQTLGYHQHMAATYIYLRRLARHFPEVGLTLATDRLLRAIEYSLHTLPGGINDTGATRLDGESAAAWKTAREAIAALTGEKPAADWQPARDVVYPDAGQVFLRSSWEPGADFLAFDASVYSGAHAHLARLGLVFRSGGRLWLADPGSFDYEMSNPFAVYGRSTPAHCTLNLNGLNQGLGDAQLVRSVITDDSALLHGIYPGGYWSGVYSWGFQEGLGQGTHGRHERIILWIRGEYLLVFDGMMCDAGQTVEHVWQLAPVAGWDHDPAALSWTTRDETPGFHLQMVLAPPAAAMTVYEGEKEPLRGWFGERAADGSGFSPAPQVVFRHPSDSTFYATLALPLAAGQTPPRLRTVPAGRGRGFALEWPDGTTDVVALSDSLCTPLDEEGPFVTDSPLVWARLGADGTMQRHIQLDGTLLRLREPTNLGGKS